MRASATLIGILALLLTSCGVDLQDKADLSKEIEKVKGPETGSIEGVLHDQAVQANTAGDYRRAAQIYKQLTDKFPDKVIYQVNLAENLRRSGDNESSLRITDTILKKNPKNADALENKGLVLMSMGEFPEAGTAFGKVMKIDPKRWRTLNSIGILFAMKGKYDSAIQYFQSALDASTDNPSVLNNAALTYAIDHQFDRSYDAFERAKRHMDSGSPELKHIDLNLALVYAVDGKLDSAEQAAAPHLSKAGLYNNMGFYSYLSKNNELAKHYLNMALTQSPVYYERAWKNLGALTGDMSGLSGDPQAMPAADATLPNAMAGSQNSGGVPLNDIPESRLLHSNMDSPYDGEEKKPQTGKAIAAPVVVVKAQPVTQLEPTDTPKPVTVAPPAPVKVVQPAPIPEPVRTAKPIVTTEEDIPHPVSTIQIIKDDTAGSAKTDEDKAVVVPQNNPDVVLLKKPKTPATNNDWDAKQGDNLVQSKPIIPAPAATVLPTTSVASAPASVPAPTPAAAPETTTAPAASGSHNSADDDR